MGGWVCQFVKFNQNDVTVLFTSNKTKNNKSVFIILSLKTDPNRSQADLIVRNVPPFQRISFTAKLSP